MREYLLFIDTEANNKSTDVNNVQELDKWPVMLQVAWIIYDSQKNFIKKESFYIQRAGVDIAPEAFALHHITPALLAEKGKKPELVLKILSEDLTRYNPVMIGHFVIFDVHLIKVEYLRHGLPDATADLPMFCTMRASAMLTDYPFKKMFKLDELYAVLFASTDKKWHDAAVDAEAAADCFYKMIALGHIRQKDLLEQSVSNHQNSKLPLVFMVLIFVITLIAVLISIG